MEAALYQAAAADITTKAMAGDLSVFQEALADLEGRNWSKMHVPLAMLLRIAATGGARIGHIDLVLHLCRDRGVLTNAIQDEEVSSIHKLLDRTPLSEAIVYGHEDLALLALPQPPTRCMYSGGENFTMLHLAAQVNALRVVEALVTVYGMDMNAKDGRGYTPLDVSVMDGHVAVARYLSQSWRIGAGIEAWLAEYIWWSWPSSYFHSSHAH